MTKSDPYLDPGRNTIPADVRRIHLTAVCGTGMGALACMLKDLGYEVTGSDQNVYPPMSDFLAAKGIRLFHGYRPENLDTRPDLVVVGNAISKDNPEARQLEALGLAYCSMPQAVNRFVADGKQTVIVTGTHGKTTTSAMMAWLLFSAGRDPSFFVGGILKNFDSNYRIGSGDDFIVEGDEYDTAFFDKGPKFNHYRPSVTILTSVEFDHADIFKDLEHVKSVFRGFLAGLDPDSALIAFDGDRDISELTRRSPALVQRYGQADGSAWRLGAVEFSGAASRFEVYKKDALFGRFNLNMIGRHNLLNALAVIAAADRIGIDRKAVSGALGTFQGVKRRQEIRGVRNGITVMDDFAHHPTAVRETVAAVRAANPRKRLVAVFEPRTNSSMRDIFQQDYSRVFDPADLVCVRHPPLLEKIPEARRFSSRQLVDDLIRRGKEARYFPDTGAIIDFLAAEARSGDLILIMSNGGFDNIHQRLLEVL
jgi:UDP-N-acetylmuramate: L-alanyl-gamma-D-glutamyl-meso-diaminopimelate ligase